MSSCRAITPAHLPATADVPALLGHIAGALASGGHLVVTYRDLTAELRGTDRFIPVRSSERPAASTATPPTPGACGSCTP
ncbi:hypothetical protein [Streptomyces sp. NPDC127190]|uniref:hypothetical protein n=1 Tax=unclassified Streptomyces TaxID=2593676 RepID=UPI00362D48D9